MSLAFRNPPVNEVVVAVYFDPPLIAFRNEHVGLFWERIRSDFPSVAQQPPLVIQPDGGVDEFFPMPRYWFIRNDDVYVIQVQKNAFMLNWRRRPEAVYPRFCREIKPTFDDYYDQFISFIEGEAIFPGPSIGHCEVTYVNIVEPCEFWEGPEDTRNVIPSFNDLAIGVDIGARKGFNCHYSYTTQDAIEVGVIVRSGLTEAQSGGTVLVFEIKALGRPEENSKPGLDAWFNRAHVCVTQCFLSLTSKTVQKEYWGPLENAK